MRQLVAGNWKMNGTEASASVLLGSLRGAAAGLACGLLVCPPTTLVALSARLLAGSAIAIGGQDCHQEAAGAHTGDISAAQLADAGASYVILGHSERRADHAETDADVRAKAVAAATAGLVAIVCVGETRAQREAGRAETMVNGQLAASLPDGFAGIIAYEPIWAIGTGLTPTEAEVGAMHGFIRARLGERFGNRGQTMPILYGGSVKPSNAGTLLGLPHVGGALVGGASLVAEDFLAIARAARPG